MQRMPFIVFVTTEYIARVSLDLQDGKTRQEDACVQRAEVRQQKVRQGRKAQAPQAKVRAIIFSLCISGWNFLQV